jgi:hypothetical protein
MWKQISRYPEEEVLGDNGNLTSLSSLTTGNTL